MKRVLVAATFLLTACAVIPVAPAGSEGSVAAPRRSAAAASHAGSLAAPATGASSQSDPAEVRQAMNAFLEALNALDAEAINSSFAPDGTAFFPVVAAERLDGKDAISDVFRTYVTETRKNVQRTNIVAEEMRIERQGDLAVVSFQVHNPAAISRRTFVFRRDSARWLIVHMHASNYRTAS